ncbi:unnamed protein product [Adineta ricciae]|uniref:Uncharacterized protein n=1 Tax=Adineta ricciae TaxID=249248 RepID=A0A813R279_ADIRI|nr:unnamed protein product [Adineta ricciae]CAF1038158.1 unnamed protein product [Adineta ricciae]
MSTTKNIYFARHGERIDQIDPSWCKTAQNPSDPPLSPDGIQQAKELGTYIASLQPRITHIYASPFVRTIQTALEIVKLVNKDYSAPDQIVKLLIEPGFAEFYISNPEWTETNIFRTLDQLSEIVPNRDYFNENYRSVFDAKYYLDLKVESRERLRDRLKRVLQKILDDHKDDCNILIVTHAAALIEGVRAFITLSKEEQMKITATDENTKSLTWDMTSVRPGVCSLTHFEFLDDKWNLKASGLTSYLSKGEQRVWVFPDDETIDTQRK